MCTFQSLWETQAHLSKFLTITNHVLNLCNFFKETPYNLSKKADNGMK